MGNFRTSPEETKTKETLPLPDVEQNQDSIDKLLTDYGLEKPREQNIDYRALFEMQTAAFALRSTKSSEYAACAANSVRTMIEARECLLKSDYKYHNTSALKLMTKSLVHSLNMEVDVGFALYNLLLKFDGKIKSYVEVNAKIKNPYALFLTAIIRYVESEPTNTIDDNEIAIPHTDILSAIYAIKYHPEFTNDKDTKDKMISMIFVTIYYSLRKFNREINKLYYLEQALEYFEDNVSALYHLGIHYFECVDVGNTHTTKGKEYYDQALKYFHKCIRISYWDSKVVKDCYIAIAFTHMALGRVDESYKYAKQVLYAEKRVPDPISHLLGESIGIDTLKKRFPDIVIVDTCDECDAKEFFVKCLCKNAFYCSDSCEAKHLILHSEICPYNRNHAKKG